MMDTAGPEHLADILGPKEMATFLADTLKLGEEELDHVQYLRTQCCISHVVSRSLSNAMRSATTRANKE